MQLASRFISTSILCITFFVSSLAAIATPLTDRNVVHLDKSFYVTGEIIWYQLYLAPNFNGKEVAVKATVLDANGKIQHSSFLKSGGSTAIDGYYKIPFNLKSGIYILQFTSINKSSKLPVLLTETQIPIYNDLEGVARTVSQQANNDLGKTTSLLDNELNISIQLPKNTFRARDKIMPTVTVMDKAGNTVAANLSVSVVDKTLVGEDLMQAENLRQGTNVTANVVNIISSDIYLRGTVKEDNGAAHAAKVVGAYSRTGDRVFYTRTNEEGNFYLAVPEFHGERSFQILGEQDDYEQVRVAGETETAVSRVQPLPFNDVISNYLTLSRQRKKIFQKYGAIESKFEPKSYAASKKLVKADVEYIIKEYEDFEFMSIFFKENLTPLRFELKDSLYLAKMYNPKNNKYVDKFFKGKPLLIIDDIVTRNGDFLARMRMSDVEKVELIYDLKKLNKNYKLFGSNGVTKITTYDKIGSLPVFEANNVITINGFQSEVAFPFFDSSLPNAKRNQPFFRPQLYWHPDLVTKKDGKTSFEYYQSDDRSTFEIRVVAQSEDGKIGYKTLTYKVQ